MVSSDPRVLRPVPSRLTYFPLGPGVVVPAWEQVSLLQGLQGWYTVVDARTGTLLYRKSTRLDLSTQPARFAVYARPDGTPLESPAPGSPNYLLPGSGTQFPTVPRTIVSMLEVQDPIASPDGWIPDGGETTQGNNTDSFLDPDGDLNDPDRMVLDIYGQPHRESGRPGQQPGLPGLVAPGLRVLAASPGLNPDAGDSPILTPFQRGSVTHLFYLVNHWHDWMYRLGFDEAAGNFQESNFGTGRAGGRPRDRGGSVRLPRGNHLRGRELYDRSRRIANVGLCRLYLWGSPEPDRDGALDSVAFHELTHGLTSGSSETRRACTGVRPGAWQRGGATSSRSP